MAYRTDSLVDITVHRPDGKTVELPSIHFDNSEIFDANMIWYSYYDPFEGSRAGSAVKRPQPGATTHGKLLVRLDKVYNELGPEQLRPLDVVPKWPKGEAGPPPPPEKR